MSARGHLTIHTATDSVPLLQHTWPSGICCCWPDGLELQQTMTSSCQKAFKCFLSITYTLNTYTLALVQALLATCDNVKVML